MFLWTPCQRRNARAGEDKREILWVCVHAKYLDDFNYRKCQCSQTQREDNKLFSRYWNLLSFNLLYVDFIAFITSLLIFLPEKKNPMMKRLCLNFMKSVFWRNITICIVGNCWEWNWKCMRKGFNILLLIPPSSLLELFSLRVVEKVMWSWLKHVWIYREIPSEFVNDKIMNVGSLNTGKQIKKNKYCSQ